MTKLKDKRLKHTRQRRDILDTGNCGYHLVCKGWFDCLSDARKQIPLIHFIYDTAMDTFPELKERYKSSARGHHVERNRMQRIAEDRKASVAARAS